MDIFNFNTQTGNNFKESEEGILVGKSGKLTLVQQWSIQYQLSVQPVYECGTSTVYFAAKHAAGSFSCERIIAEKFEDIRSNFGDICDPADLSFKAITGQCSGNTPVTLQMKGTILNGVTFSGQAQQAYVAEGISAVFAGLETIAVAGNERQTVAGAVANTNL